MYKPDPIDTGSVSLPEELAGLCELLARNTHECWARRRIEDGWRWGPVRDDVKKLHPCLVPYDALPESEREYDRITSQETLKVICSLGFRIVKD